MSTSQDLDFSDSLNSSDDPDLSYISDLSIAHWSLQQISRYPEMCNKYIPVSCAGTGTTGSVYFYIPRHTDVLRKQSKKTETEDRVKDLKSQLVAIKISHSKRQSSSDEVQVLKSILHYADGNAQKHHCVQLLGYDIGFETSGVCHWFVLSAYTNSLTLLSFREFSQDTRSTIPEEPIYHFFIQIMEALYFLTRTCNPPVDHNNLRPPVDHGDIHGGNIMLDVSANGPIKTLPNLVIIDFDCAPISEPKNDYLMGCNEIDCFCKLRHECSLDAYMDQHKHCGHPDGWLEFEKMLYWNNSDRPQDVASMLEMYEDLARKGTDNIFEARAKNVRDLVDLAGRKITRELEDDLTKILQMETSS